MSGSGAVGQYIRGRSSDNIGSLYFTSNASASTEYGYVQGRSTDLRIQGFNNGLILQPSSGNVGIGTSSPSTKLHLGGTAPGDSIIRQDSTGSGTNWEIGEREAGKWQIFEDDSDSVVATFTSTGSVGIGTSSINSNAALEVHGGQLRVASSSASSMFAVATSTTYSDGVTLFSSYNGSGAYGPMIFDVNGERMRISAEGYVTTPYQPVFATTGTNYTQVSNILTKIIPNAVAFDIGNNYSNGVFTAPVAGVYEFAFWGLVYPITTSTINFTIAYFKNSAFAGTEVQSSGPNNQHSMVAGSILLNLSQYDTVHLELNTSQGGAYNGQWNMSGKLIG